MTITLPGLHCIGYDYMACMDYMDPDVACSAPSHYLNQCWLIGKWAPVNKFQWNSNRNYIIFIQENAFEIVVCQNGGHFVQGDALY